MKHIDQIQKYISLLARSKDYHCLFINGQRGIGKSSTVDIALNAIKVGYKHLGTHTTALGLYNALYELKSGEFGVLDDSGGLFEGTSLDILKSALAPAAGSDGKRVLRWTSTTTLSAASEFCFEGKLIIVTNVIPNTPAVKPLKDRCYFYQINLSTSDLALILTKASENVARYPDQVLAKVVLEFMLDILNINESIKEELNLRTFAKIYEMACLEPDLWQELARDMLPSQALSSEDVINKLSKSGLNPNKIAKEYIKITGKCEKTFWNHWNKFKNNGLVGVN